MLLMARILKYKYKLLLTLMITVFFMMIGTWAYTIMESQSTETAIQGVMDGKQQIFEDEYLKIFNRESLQVTEEKKADKQFNRDITKRWFYFYENENLRNGFEAFYYMDSSENSNEEIVKGLSKYLGFEESAREKVLGCNEEQFYKLNKSNVNPINYFVNVKGNRVFILKHFDQLKQNKFFLNLNNFCLKN